MRMGKALVHPVADGAVVVQRAEYLADFVQNVFYAHHVEEAFLLPCKGSVGQVFGCRRRTHRERRLRRGGAQHGEGRTNLPLQRCREGLRGDHRANVGTGRSKRTHVVGVKPKKTLLDFLRQSVVRKKVPKCVRGGGKAGRHPHPGGQMGDHLAEAGVLPAHRLDVAHSQVLKRYDQGGRSK